MSGASDGLFDAPRSLEDWAAIMRVLYTQPSATRNVSLFPNSRSAALNNMAYRLMPSTGGLDLFGVYHRAFCRSHGRLARKPRFPPHKLYLDRLGAIRKATP